MHAVFLLPRAIKSNCCLKQVFLDCGVKSTENKSFYDALDDMIEDGS